MEALEVTSMSSRGQIVLPKKIRIELDLKEGEKFVVYTEDKTVMLKKIDRPKHDFRKFNKLLKETRELIKESGMTEQEMLEAIKIAREKKKNESCA